LSVVNIDIEWIQIWEKHLHFINYIIQWLW